MSAIPSKAEMHAGHPVSARQIQVEGLGQKMDPAISILTCTLAIIVRTLLPLAWQALLRWAFAAAASGGRTSP